MKVVYVLDRHFEHLDMQLPILVNRKNCRSIAVAKFLKLYEFCQTQQSIQRSA